MNQSVLPGFEFLLMVTKEIMQEYPKAQTVGELDEMLLKVCHEANNESISDSEFRGMIYDLMLREQSRSFLEQHCLMQACIDKKLSSIQTELDANTNMTRRLQSRKAELYEQYRAGRISREKFADIQKTDSEKLARLSSRAEEIKRLLVEQYESRGNLAAGKRTADQIILLKDYDPEIIRNFVERVRVYPSGEIEIDMRTSSGFEFVTAS